MTVTTELSRSTHPWTGVETFFAPGFSADREEDVLVFFRTIGGVQSQLTPGVNHNVALASETKIITITPISLPAGAGTVVVRRATPALVQENLVDGEEFSLAVIQQLHDRAAMRSAEDRLAIARAITLPETAEPGIDNYDFEGSGISNLKPGTADTDAATVGQVQAMQVAEGNVPSPVLGDVAKLLIATAQGVFGWVALGLSHIANGLFTANPAGRAKFGAGFVDTGLLANGALSADSAGLAKMGDGFLAATAAGRAKMAPGFVTFDELAATAKAFGAPVNLGLSAAVAGNALTISLTNAAGAAPSAASQVLIPFRSDAAASGVALVRQVATATALVISSGSLMGFANATAGRLWIVAFDDDGTSRLGAINCRNGVNVFPLGQFGIASSTAEGGAGAADSAHVFYTGTAVSSKAYTVLGYIEWSAGLTTAGAWGIVPTGIEVFRPGMKLPGEIVQRAVDRYQSSSDLTAIIPNDDTVPQNTEGTQIGSLSVTPSSAANLVRARFDGQCDVGAPSYALVALFNGGANAVASGYTGIVSAGFATNLWVEYLGIAGTAASQSWTVRVGPSASTMRFNGVYNGRRLGGSLGTLFSVEEVVS